MELKYGNRRTFEISLTAALTISLSTYLLLNMNIGLAFFIFFVTLVTFGGVLRCFNCANWIKADAAVIDSTDLSKIIIDWRGGASLFSSYNANIEYFVDGIAYTSEIRITRPPKKRISIFYKPGDPNIICLNKGLGWEGISFLTILLLVLISKLYPGLFIFDILKSISDSLASFKESIETGL